MIISNKKNILEDYLKYLDSQIPNIYIYSKGNDKISIILEIDSKHRYKADIFRTNIEMQYSMLLYSTGSKNFNIKMRGRAKQLGYLLNQKGLFDKDGNKIIASNSNEKMYFKTLNMKYLKPEDRI
jgi:DNA polymerase (family 10)